MRIPKLSVLLCAALVGLIGSVRAQTPDSDLQNKAREELRQKMAELNQTNTPPPAAPVAAPVAAPEKKKKKAAKPKPAPAAPVAQPAPVAPVVTMTPAEPAPVTPAAVTPVEPVTPVMPVTPVAPAPVKTVPTVTSPSAVVSEPVPVAPNPEAQSKAQDALRQKMMELDTQQPGPAVSTSPAAPGKTMNVPPMTAPAMPPPMTTAAPPSAPPMLKPAPSGISESKEAQLAELLQLYKADKITPMEYHQRRAKILAQP